ATVSLSDLFTGGVTVLVDRSRHDRSPLHGGADQKHGQGLRGAPATGGHTVSADDPASVPRGRGRPRLPPQGSGGPHGARAPSGGEPPSALARHASLRARALQPTRGS